MDDNQGILDSRPVPIQVFLRSLIVVSIKIRSVIFCSFFNSLISLPLSIVRSGTTLLWLLDQPCSCLLLQQHLNFSPQSTNLPSRFKTLKIRYLKIRDCKLTARLQSSFLRTAKRSLGRLQSVNI